MTEHTRRKRRKPRRTPSRRGRRGPEGEEVPLEAEHEGATVHVEAGRLDLGSLAGARAFAAEHEAAPGHFLDGLERWGWQLLAESGGEDEAREAERALRARLAEGATAPEATGLWPGVGVVAKEAPPHSQRWASANALLALREARRALERVDLGDRPGDAARWAAFEVGKAVQLLEHASWKKDVEPDSLKRRSEDVARRARAPRARRERAKRYRDDNEHLRHEAYRRWEAQERPPRYARTLARTLHREGVDRRGRSAERIYRIIQPALR